MIAGVDDPELSARDQLAEAARGLRALLAELAAADSELTASVATGRRLEGIVVTLETLACCRVIDVCPPGRAAAACGLVKRADPAGTGIRSVSTARTARAGRWP